jgi:hypothetical protein
MISYGVMTAQRCGLRALNRATTEGQYPDSIDAHVLYCGLAFYEYDENTTNKHRPTSWRVCIEAETRTCRWQLKVRLLANV